MAGPMNIAAGPEGPERATTYSWIVFAFAFGLLISDFMSRQVLNAVFPLLKTQWQLTDGQLGWLSGIVALMVGLLTFPFSVLADRWGRVKSLTAMAVLWSLATLLCAAAQSYGQMLGARLMVGVGEAAYGSVGIALVISVFPKHMRATLSSAFMAGGLFGQVLGVAVGAQIAASHGWRSAFMVIGLMGLVIAVAFPIVVREKRVAALSGRQPVVGADAPSQLRPPLRSLFASRAIVLTYIASGLQFFTAGAMPAWLPTYFVRYYDMPLAEAGRTTAVLLVVSGIGMVVCGMISDKLSRHHPQRKTRLAIGYCLGAAAALFLAMQCAPGMLQLGLLAIAMFIVSGTAGPVGAMVANLTPLAIHGTAFATLTLANNLLGFAPGPIVTGRIADQIGLLGALQMLPIAGMLAALIFFIVGRSYLADLATLSGLSDQQAP